MAVKDVNFETLSYIIHENKAQKRANHSAPPLKNPHKWDSSFSPSFIYSLPENIFFPNT